MEKEFYYSESYECEINTADVYHAVSGECSKQFSEAILQDFIQTLEQTLIQKGVEPTAPFYPTNWLYFKQQYLTWRDAEYRTDIFRPDFFIRSCENYSFDLTDDEWLSMVYKKRENVEQEYNRYRVLLGGTAFSDLPLAEQKKIKKDEEMRILKEKKSGIEYIEDISEKKKQEVVAKLKSGKHSQILDDDDPFQWIRWSYDVYAHYQECVLSYTQDRKPFEYFFAFRLELIDPYDVKLFLNWHLENTFEGDAENLKEFIEILYMKFPKILANPNIKLITFKFLDRLESIINNNNIVDDNTIIDNKVEDTKRLGRKVVEKIEIPKPLDRAKGDKKTILSKQETGILFSYLAQLNCVFNNKDSISLESFYKAIQVLTGYSSKQLKGFLIYEDELPKNKNEEKKIVERIKDLIMSKL